MLTALYRHFDGNGVLLYVGISLRPVQRLGAHASGSKWADKIARVTVEWRQSREDALVAEAAAILNEKPIHNIIGQPSTAQPTRKTTAPTSAPPPPPPRAPIYFDYPEKVAAHFSVSLRAIARSIQEGMPRERISARRYRYELGACEDWFRAQDQKFTAEKKAAAEKAHSAATEVMRAAMERAFSKAGKP